MKHSLASLPGPEPGLGVGGRGMSRVRPLATVEVGLVIAPAIVGGRIGAVGRLEALHRILCYDQRAVDREAIGRQKPSDPRLSQNRLQELRRDIAFEQAITAFEKNAEVSLAGSSTPIPTNQRNRRSNSSRSIS
jgi:hypothetical protein